MASLSIHSIAASNTKKINSIDGIRVWPAPENTRIVFDLKSKPDYKYFSLSKPNRLVIDFSNTKNSVALKSLANHDPRIKLFRTSNAKAKSSTRLVLELAKSYNLTVFPLAPAGQYGNRLVIDLYDKSRTTNTITKPAPRLGNIVIGIDAGHGGVNHGFICTQST